MIYDLYRTTTAITQCGSTPTTPYANPAIEIEFHFLRTSINFWRDQNCTQETPFEEGTRGDEPWYIVKQDYHRAHSALMFKKLHEASRKGGEVDWRVMDFGETRCSCFRKIVVLWEGWG